MISRQLGVDPESEGVGCKLDYLPEKFLETGGIQQPILKLWALKTRRPMRF
jgi:hypothetical protein